ncbi:ZIP zinc/iron transport family [Meredithblackwellia eburnea MCA 4105]
MSNTTISDGGEDSGCIGGSPYNGNLGLRIGAIFVILVTSLFGTLLPVISRKVRRLGVPENVYEFVKYFGSGVIIATSFIHLLAPAFDSLSSPCLTGTWTKYDWAPAIAMFSAFSIFIVELVCHRAGASYLRRQGLKSHDQHNSSAAPEPSHTIHGAHVEERGQTGVNNTGEVSATTESGSVDPNDPKDDDDREQGRVHDHDHDHDSIDKDALAQILGTLILEFGVIFHSLVIGLTLAVVADFATLFVVIVFHQMFEGLGLGARLSALRLPKRLRWAPYAGACIYPCITPLGIAIGLGVRQTYNPDSGTAAAVSGVLDAFSAGVLLWSGLVECLAHDFIFNRAMATEASNLKVTFAVGSVLLGAGLMALLGAWA